MDAKHLPQWLRKQTPEPHSREERKASKKNKRGDLEQSTDPARFAPLQRAGKGLLQPPSI